MPLVMPSEPCPPRSAFFGAASFAAALGAVLMLTACNAPGMKLNARADSQPTTTERGGLQVTLRKLDPQTVIAQSHRPIDMNVLAPLLVSEPKPYLIGPQDVLLATVWDHPEITLALGQYRTDNATGSLVDEEGYIYFPYVGRIKVQGLTATQARTALTAALAKVLQNPQVDVKVLAFRSQKIYVGGEVKTPATYTVTDVPFNLSEAINRAGGFTPLADDSRILLTRDKHTWILDFQALVTWGGLANKIYLQDGDTLMVPNNLEAPVYLMGEVTKPGTLPLIHGNLSLAKALSDAGGILSISADARSIYVIRQGQAANAVDVYHLDAKNPTAMILADRFALYPRDIVYVDAGAGVRFARVMELVIPTFEAVTSAYVGGAEAYYFKTHP